MMETLVSIARRYILVMTLGQGTECGNCGGVAMVFHTGGMYTRLHWRQN